MSRSHTPPGNAVLCLGLLSAIVAVHASAQPLPGEMQTPEGTRPSMEPTGASRADSSAPTLQARDEYLQVVARAISEFDAGHFSEARSLFLRAHGLWPSARTLRTLGMTAFELRMYPRAVQELQAALVDPRRPLPAGPRQQVTALLEQARSYVGSYHLQLSPAEAELTVDGTSPVLGPGNTVTLSVGTHELQARAAGHVALRRTLEVRGGEDETVALTLQPISLPVVNPSAVASRFASPESASASTQHVEAKRGRARVLTFAAFGVGAGGFATTAILGGLALERKRSLEEHCSDQRCPPAYWKEERQAKRLANAATCGLALGVVGAGTALYLWIREKRAAKSTRAAQLAPWLGRDSTSIAGSF